MSSRVRKRLVAAGGAGTAALAVLLLADGSGFAQQGGQPSSPQKSNNPSQAGQPNQPSDEIRLRSITPQVMPRQQYTGKEEAGKLLQVPVSNLFPGTVAVDPNIQ